MMSVRHHRARQEVLVQGPFPITDGGRQDPEPEPPSPAIKRERRLGLLLLVVVIAIATLIALGASDLGNDSGGDAVAAPISIATTFLD